MFDLYFIHKPGEAADVGNENEPPVLHGWYYFLTIILRKSRQIGFKIFVYHTCLP
jgi:hypothetical protein